MPRRKIFFFFCQWQFGSYVLKVLTSQFSELETSWGEGRSGGEKLSLSQSSECVSERPRGDFSASGLPPMPTVLTHPNLDVYCVFRWIRSY